MRLFLTLSLLALFHYNGNSQITKTEIKPQVIIEERTIGLNGGLRAMVGGQSRVAIPVDIPNGTIEWYYSFSSSPGSSGSSKLNLALQLSSYAFDATGLTAKVLSLIEIPPGTNAVDVYLMNEKNKTHFLADEAFHAIEEGSVEATKQGLIKVDDVTSGRWFIIIDNPSTLDGITVQLEVVAIVEKDIYIDQWSEENLSIIGKKCRDNFMSDGNVAAKNEVCSCYIETLKSKITPAAFHQLGEQKTVYRNAAIDECYLSTGNQALRKIEATLNHEQERIAIAWLIEESAAAANINDFDKAKNKILLAAKDIERLNLQVYYQNDELIDICNTLIWYSVLTNDLETARGYLQKGMALDGENMYLWNITGCYHLLSGNTAEAEKVFARYKRKAKLPDGKRWHELVADHLAALENQGLGNDGFPKIRALLNIN